MGTLSRGEQDRQRLESVVEVVKGLVEHRAQTELGQAFAETLLGCLLIESAGALTGSVGKLLIKVLFKQLDTSGKRLKKLENLAAHLERQTLMRASQKFVAALAYDNGTPESSAFRIQLFHEARQGLEETLDYLTFRGEPTSEVALAIGRCALEVPGGRAYALEIAREAVEMQRRRIAKLTDKIENLKYQETLTKDWGERQSGTTVRSRIVQGFNFDEEVPVYETFEYEMTPEQLQRKRARLAAEREPVEAERQRREALIRVFETSA